MTLAIFQIEMERMSSRIDHLRSQNDVLSLTLAESKGTCEDLTVAIGTVPYIA